ncbi:SRPBCC family protein [Saccharopolyspora sp. NPDC049357]|uniref:SRPBCC family protein n=1 Tax=Saccharopolyspora sp. NPDC049357 TaxID=3154507 RepID=UPI00342C9960
MTRTANGLATVSFVRMFPHPPEKVWRALTQPEHLAGWFAQYLDFNRSRLEFGEEGSKLEFRPKPAESQIPAETGRVERCRPPSLLEYTWGEEALRWELEPDGPSGCRVTFTNTFADPSFAPFNALGWHTGLDRLRAVLDDDDPSSVYLEVSETAASELQQRYERAFA